jgi:hypothetical protein
MGLLTREKYGVMDGKARGMELFGRMLQIILHDKKYIGLNSLGTMRWSAQQGNR